MPIRFIDKAIIGPLMAWVLLYVPWQSLRAVAGNLIIKASRQFPRRFF